MEELDVVVVFEDGVVVADGDVVADVTDVERESFYQCLYGVDCHQLVSPQQALAQFSPFPRLAIDPLPVFEYI